MTFADPVRRILGQRVPPSRETVRRLAFEVMRLAGRLAGLDAPENLERITTARMLASARDLLAMADQHAEEADQQLAVLRRENAQLLRAVSQASQDQAVASASPAPPSDPPAIARDLMELADRVASTPDDSDIRWLGSHVAKLLAHADIQLINDDGYVDPARHEVVAVRDALTEGPDNYIAATARAGYMWRGQILRPQQVVAYIKVRNP